MARSDLPEPSPASGLKRLSAIGVHLFTACGAALGLLALLAAAERDYAGMFAWLGAALFVDGVDGGLARKAEVRANAPAIDGGTLDLVVDYVTYVLVPAYALATADLLPEDLKLAGAAIVCVSAALYFALATMKTDDWYFWGFPAVWNVVAFYLFLLEPPPFLAFAAIVALAGLSFAPVAFVHPFRVRRSRALTVALLLVWCALASVAIWRELRPDTFVIWGLVAVGLYFALSGLSRSGRFHGSERL